MLISYNSTIDGMKKIIALLMISVVKNNFMLPKRPGISQRRSQSENA
jgi:hypothetical protein